MPLPDSLSSRLRLPVVAAPMFLVSGPDLVVSACRAGVIGSFPALNRRTTEGFDQWLDEIAQRLKGHPDAAPYAVNLIVHRSNPRLADDLKVCARHEVPIVITSLGAAPEVVRAVHGWGGLVFHDVTNLRHAQKAAAAGVDGLILVAAGAGGHAGTWSPFALVSEVRAFFHGTILLAGCISTGEQVLAAEAMGADLAYMGTRFIATQESLAEPDYKQMICQAHASDIVYTPNISGVPANFLRPSIERAGLDPEQLTPPRQIDFGAELTTDAGEKRKGAWKEIWSAGQGVGAIHDVPTTAELVDRLCAEYGDALRALTARARARPCAG